MPALTRQLYAVTAPDGVLVRVTAEPGDFTEIAVRDVAHRILFEELTAMMDDGLTPWQARAKTHHKIEALVARYKLDAL